MIDIEKLQKEKAHLIDKYINEALAGNVDNLHDAMKFHMVTGGKRVRPLLAIVTYEALQGKKDSVQGTYSDSDKIMPFAAACELLHNWFLIHDDIEDSDKVRRDQPAVWVKYGMAHGINIGDYMAHKVFDLAILSKEKGVSSDKTLKLVQSIVTTCLRTAEGQALDISMRQSGSPTEKDYMDMIQGKTGHYLTLPMIGAAIIQDREELIPKLIEFGKNLGAVFQITDDILDLTEGKGRGEIGRDIKEGKRSLMVVHCLSYCNTEEKTKMIFILNKTPDDTTDKDILEIKSLFKKYGSIKYCQEKAQYFSSKAKEVAKTMPELTEILEFFTDYITQRRK